MYPQENVATIEMRSIQKSDHLGRFDCV